MSLSTYESIIPSLFEEGLKRASKIAHATFWMEGSLYSEENKTNMFVFCTVNKDTAQKVQSILEQHKLLCNTDLGSVHLRVKPNIFQRILQRLRFR